MKGWLSDRMLLSLALAPLLSACIGELEGPLEQYRSDVGAAGSGSSAGNGGTSGGTSGEDAEACVKAIFSESCAASICHDSEDPTGELDLSGTDALARLSGRASSQAGCEDRMLIVPGDAMESFLVEKVSTSTPQCGGRMPFGGELPPADLQCFVDWVASLGSSTPEGNGAP